MSGGRLGTGGKLAWGLIALLAVLHWDFWYWDDTTLVFGFLPIGLLYQAGISLAAAVAWSLVIRFAWPAHVEAWAEAGASEAAGEPAAKEVRP